MCGGGGFNPFDPIGSAVGLYSSGDDVGGIPGGGGLLPGIDTGTATPFVNPINVALYDAATSSGPAEIIDALLDPVTGPGIDAVSGGVGDLLGPEIRGYAPMAGSVIGGVVGGVYGMPEVGAAVGNAIGGKIAGKEDLDNMISAGATYVTASALSSLGDVVAGDALGGGLTDPNMLEAAAQLDAGIDLVGGIESGYGFGTAAPIGASTPGILQRAATSVGEYVTNPANIPEIIGAGTTIAEILTSPAIAGGNDLPELPALLTPMEQGEALPPLPDRLGQTTLPEGLTFPDVEPYLPKNWDDMSEADKQAWMITRGAEISKRRRGTWAGDLEGIRSGKKAGLEYAELVGDEEGKSILGE